MSKFKENITPKLIKLFLLAFALLYLYYLLFMTTGIHRNDFPSFKK